MFDEWMEELGLDDEAVLQRAARGLPPVAQPDRPANRQYRTPRMSMPAAQMAMPSLPNPAQQADILQDMADKTTAAFRRENDSRISQLREARRMEHEREMERMRIDALLRRLQQPASPITVVPPGGSIVFG